MKRSAFSLSHYKLLTCDMGELVPIGLTEVLPGDTIQQASSLLLRVSPLLAPVMHPVRVRIHHWFVPHRIVWEDWEDFITGGPTGTDSSVFPTRPGTYSEGGLGDYLGIPPNVPLTPSVLPMRGYAMIWNEWYRDQDLQAEIPISLASGPDSTTNVGLQKVAWEKDYFTSARPWTQKGDQVLLPIGGIAPVTGIPGAAWPEFNVGGQIKRIGTDNATDNNAVFKGSVVGGAYDASWATTGLQAELTGTTAVAVNELREAFALQRYQEARARYGSRYTEYLRYLGVKSSDARLQRPEYLGGGKQTIQFSEVLQTAPGADPDGGVVGDLKGHGIGAMRSNRYRRFFEEHGYIFSLLSVLPKTMYSSALPKTWSRQTKEDFFQKELQHIGQQAILNKEVHAAHTKPNDIFGYQDRYDEYRRSESTIAGDFRTTLDHWHYARMFAGDVALNSDFVTADPTKRVNAVQSEDCLWIMANHSIQARRLVAKSGTSFIR